MKYRVFFSLLIICLISGSLQAQTEKPLKPLFVGGSFIIDYPQSSSRFQPTAGVGLISMFAKKHGVEFGLYQRKYDSSTSLIISDGQTSNWVIIDVEERHLSVPLLYRFQSRWLHASIGPQMDFFTGWKQVSDKSIATVTEYDRFPAVDFGIMFKLGHPFQLSPNLILVPEFRANPTITYGRIYTGLGISLWYQTR